MDIIKVLAEEFKLRTHQVEETVKLIDEGNTIPFIARYRKEVTGHKINGPKGIGAVYLREGWPIKPLIFGGGQEHGCGV